MVSPSQTSSLLLIACLIPTSLAAAKCYKPDGTSVGVEFTPCNSNTKFSMCYRTGTANGILPDTTCYPNGISLNVDTVTGAKGYWRQMCTDASWESPYCLKAFDKCTKVSSSIYLLLYHLTRRVG